MKSILFILLLIIPTTSCAMMAIHTIRWKINEQRGIVSIKSQHDIDTDNVFKIYRNSVRLFFGQFEKRSRCVPQNTLHINIVSGDILRSKRYFTDARSTNFGRYFAADKTIFITDEISKHPEYLAHEIAHYFYDECGAKFKSSQIEHNRVYKFQDLYQAYFK